MKIDLVEEGSEFLAYPKFVKMSFKCPRCHYDVEVCEESFKYKTYNAELRYYERLIDILKEENKELCKKIDSLQQATYSHYKKNFMDW